MITKYTCTFPSKDKEMPNRGYTSGVIFKDYILCHSERKICNHLPIKYSMFSLRSK